MTGSWTPEALDAGRRLFAGPVDFVMGVARLDQVPEARRPEVALAGRSNVGKSSLINALCLRKDLARASHTPGRTRELNYYDVGGVLSLVDMPGYGFAAAAKKDVARWQALLRGFLRGRPSLVRVFLLIDARHGIKQADGEMMDLLDEAAVPYQIVLTKIDKVAEDGREAVAAAVRAVAVKRPAAIPSIHVTSSHSRAGIAELQAEIAALA